MVASKVPRVSNLPYLDGNCGHLMFEKCLTNPKVLLLKLFYMVSLFRMHAKQRYSQKWLIRPPAVGGGLKYWTLREKVGSQIIMAGLV